MMFLHRSLRYLLLSGGALLLCIIISAAVFAPALAPKDPLAPDLYHRLKPPSALYPLGTDHLGRCMLSRLLFGARTSLTGALSASALSVFVGIGVGSLAGLSGAGIGFFLNAVIDMALALPGLIVALVLSGLLGNSIQSLVIGLVMAGWPWWARLARSLTISASRKEFVLAGRVAGVRGMRLLLCYLLPQFSTTVMAAMALKTGWILLAFSGLSYLGLGPPPPTPEWGRMLQEAAVYLPQAPWLMLAPGSAITLTVMALNFIGEALDHDNRDSAV